jgi:hypothetical protein
MKKFLSLIFSICLSCQGAGIVSGTLSGVGTGSGSGGNTVVAGAGLSGSTNGSTVTLTTNGSPNGVALTTFTYSFNAATNTIYVNSNAFPEIVASQVVLEPSPTTPGYAQLNIVGSSQVYQVLSYNTNGAGSTQNNVILSGIIPANASFYITFPDFPGGGASTQFNSGPPFNTTVYGTTTGTFPTGSGILTQNGSGTNTILLNARLNGNTQFANGVFPGPNFVFDAGGLLGGDESISISGDTNSSGAGFVFDILSAVPDATLQQTPNGYPIADATSIVGVPTGSIYTDFPGDLLIVSPQAEFVIAGNNSPRLVMAGNNSAQAGRMGAPYLGGSTNINMYALAIKNGTNVYTRTADAPKLFEWDTLGGGFYVYNTPNGFTLANGCTLTDTNGIILKANGKLNNTKAFDSADVGVVNLSSAEIFAGQFVTSATGTTNGFFDVQQSGWNTDGSGGMLFQSQGTGVFFCDNTGIYSRAALDNTLICGTTGNTWKQVATHTLMMSSATNQACGKFVLNGTSTVNVGNTTVSASCTILCQEVAANGGTQSGIIIITGETSNTGFAVKSIALDTSICNYEIIQNPF